MAVLRYLKLNDNAASTTVVADTGANATLSGGANTSARQTGSGPGGSINYAFDLNGTADFVSLGAADVYDFAGGVAFSVSLWFNADALSGCLIGRTGSGFRGIIFTAATTIQIETSSAYTPYTVPTMSTGTWYHLFVIRTSGNSLRLWLNGVESSTGAISNGGLFTFDSVGKRSSTFFNGRISQVRIFNSDESANVGTYYAEGVTSGPATRSLLLGAGR